MKHVYQNPFQIHFKRLFFDKNADNFGGNWGFDPERDKQPSDYVSDGVKHLEIISADNLGQIRNGLLGINWLVEIIRDRELPMPSRPYINRIIGEAQQADGVGLRTEEVQRILEKYGQLPALSVRLVIELLNNTKKP